MRQVHVQAIILTRMQPRPRPAQQPCKGQAAEHHTSCSCCLHDAVMCAGILAGGCQVPDSRPGRLLLLLLQLFVVTLLWVHPSLCAQQWPDHSISSHQQAQVLRFEVLWGLTAAVAPLQQQQQLTPRSTTAALAVRVPFPVPRCSRCSLPDNHANTCIFTQARYPATDVLHTRDNSLSNNYPSCRAHRATGCLV